MPKPKSRKKKLPKRVLALPDLEQARTAVLNSLTSASGQRTYEERQQRLCLEVFQAAEVGKGDVIIDVGFGSGEQDFLLSNAREFRRLMGFNISDRQVRYANERALLEAWHTGFRSAWEKPSVFPASRAHRWTEFWRSSARSTSIGRASTSARRRS